MASVQKLTNGVTLPHGVTNEQNKKVYAILLDYVNSFVLYEYNYNKYPKTRYRLPKATLECFMTIQVDSLVTAKYNSFFHSSSVVDLEKQKVTVDIREKYNNIDMENGDDYWIAPKKLMLTISGDGLEFPNNLRIKVNKNGYLIQSSVFLSFHII